MARKKIYDSEHQGNAIRNWKRRGLICREGETYKEIYSFVMNTDFCNLCNVKFNNEIHNDKRCMDHDHDTGFFRKVLCNSCNSHYMKDLNKTEHMFISPKIDKKKNGKIFVSFQYQRKGFKQKASQSLTKLIALSFIHILKKPV